ncbi:MAG TPA: V-type ATP synthase subunit E [Candidatus Lachnoclostridium stercoravium]|uniref:V-type ATP synthase subunit E n=1 Tax=Candidatus Lachnoclostridium stercoravium TaxID=2838633 RepID=A0A9D2HKR0_9FIRM|nr:V-type ATP synthase subunit E [Candidatus Lachnoclostridium stercoravium]
MTTEEKLQHFLDFCMEDVRGRSGKMLDDYEASLEKTFEEHKANASDRAKMQIRIQKETIKREMNKRLSLEQLELKRKVSKKQEELKDMLFVELRDYLAKFESSPAYYQLLEQQIKAAKDFSGDEHMVIFMDPADEKHMSRLAYQYGVRIQASDQSFLGGTIAVIPAKNILIDNSFSKKLVEARQNFSFGVELADGGESDGK